MLVVLEVSSGNFERACMLFNIASMQSQIAEAQSHTTDEGLKLSAKFFMVKHIAHLVVFYTLIH